MLSRPADSFRIATNRSSVKGTASSEPPAAPFGARGPKPPFSGRYQVTGQAEGVDYKKRRDTQHAVLAGVRCALMHCYRFGEPHRMPSWCERSAASHGR